MTPSALRPAIAPANSYAATIHKVQGATFDKAYVLASSHMDRHAAYVAMSRHRDAMSLRYGREEFAEGVDLAPILSRASRRQIHRKDVRQDRER